MHLAADLHTHTIASGHALSTLNEMIDEARRLGYSAMATTDHASKLNGLPPPYYFNSLLHAPDVLDDGFVLLKGIEANLLDADGTLDVPDDFLALFDWTIASFHKILVQPLSVEQATAAWLRVAENPHIDMIGHSEQAEFKYDYDRVTKAFAQHGKVVEMNASSAISRPGNEGNLLELARCCKKNGTSIAIVSDAHSTFQMRDVQKVAGMLNALNFPEERIVNTTMGRLVAELKRHGRPIVGRLEAAGWRCEFDTTRRAPL